MNQQRKTVQAIKISASWTPLEQTAFGMAEAAFGAMGGPGGLRIEGGRILIRHAIAVDMANPEHYALVSRRIKQISNELNHTGTVHSFTTVAGAVPEGLAQHLPEPDQAQEQAA